MQLVKELADFSLFLIFYLKEKLFKEKQNCSEEIMKTEQEKLIVTVTTANAWIYPEAKNYPKTPEEIAETVYRCYSEGASIAHVHLPKNASKKTVELIREKCDIIIQAGMSSDPINER